MSNQEGSTRTRRISFQRLSTTSDGTGTYVDSFDYEEGDLFIFLIFYIKSMDLFFLQNITTNRFLIRMMKLIDFLLSPRYLYLVVEFELYLGQFHLLVVSVSELYYSY